MRILVNVSKAELDYLTSQPTAKAMIEKLEKDAIYIPEGDAQAAARFVAMRNSQKQGAYLELSDEGMAALQKAKETKENTTQEEQLKEKIAELEEELAEVKAQPVVSEEAKAAQKKKIDAITQQILMLNMQLIQLQKEDAN